MHTPKTVVKILNRLRILNYLNLNSKILLNGENFKIPILNRTGFSNLSISEPWMIELLDIVLAIENHGFIDVGVNIGQTLIKLKSVSRKTKYIGFEPNPICIQYLDKLAKSNDLKDVLILPIGISDKTQIGALNFFSSSTTDSSASIIENFRPSQKIYNINHVPLFKFKDITDVVKLDKISVIKIDVEGAELEVLNGLHSLIKDQKPIIFIEILPAYTKQNFSRVKRQNKIQHLFGELDYSIFRVVKESDILLDLEEISNIEVHSDINKCEYVIVPKIKKNDFKNSYQSRLK